MTAIAPKHHNAIVENRRAARPACCPPRTTWVSSASSPPAHRLPATRWISRLLVAKSWEPPADECPVNPSGINVNSDPPSSNGVHDHRNTGRLATVTTAANSAVHRHAVEMLIMLASDHRLAGFR